MPKGITANHRWKAQTEKVDFLRNDGGPYGVKLVMTASQSARLSHNLDLCAKNAQKFGVEKTEVDIHWGRRGKRGAFRITIRAVND